MNIDINNLSKEEILELRDKLNNIVDVSSIYVIEHGIKMILATKAREWRSDTMMYVSSYDELKELASSKYIGRYNTSELINLEDYFIACGIDFESYMNIDELNVFWYELQSKSKNL